MSLCNRNFRIQHDRLFDVYIYVILNEKGHEECWFRAQDVASFLRYKKPNNAIHCYVKEKWRKSFEHLQKGRIHVSNLPENWQPQTVFMNVAGLAAMAVMCTARVADSFQNWLFETLLPTLRRKGFYAMPTHDSQQASTSSASLNNSATTSSPPPENETPTISSTTVPRTIQLVTTRTYLSKHRFRVRHLYLRCWVFSIVKDQDDTEFWFKACEIAQCLGYKWPQNAIDRHVKPKWKTDFKSLNQQHIVVPKNCKPQAIFVNEPGLWKLLAICRLPIAVKFQDWLFEKLLPSLLRDGYYDMRSRSHLRQELRRKDETIATLTNQVVEQRNKIIEQREKMAVMTKDSATRHTLTVLKRKLPDSEVNDYKLIRVQLRNLSRSMKRTKEDPYSYIVMIKYDVPNAMNILPRVKEVLKAIDVEFQSKYNTICLSSNYDFENTVENVLDEHES